MPSRTVFDRPLRRDPILIVWAVIVLVIGWVALSSHTTWSGSLQGYRVLGFLNDFCSGVMTSFLLLALLPALLRWVWRHGWPRRRRTVAPAGYSWHPGPGAQPGQPWPGGFPQGPAPVATAAGVGAGGPEDGPGFGPGRCPRWTCCQARDDDGWSAGLRAPRDPDPLDAGRWVRAVSTQRLAPPPVADPAPPPTPAQTPGSASSPAASASASATDDAGQPVVDLPHGRPDFDEPDLRIPAPHVDLGDRPGVWPPAPGMQLPPIDVSLPPGRFALGRPQEDAVDARRDRDDERGRR